MSHFSNECPTNTQGDGRIKAQSSSADPIDISIQNEATSRTEGATNRLYVVASFHDYEKSPNVVTVMVEVFSIFTFFFGGLKIRWRKGTGHYK